MSRIDFLSLFRDVLIADLDAIAWGHESDARLDDLLLCVDAVDSELAEHDRDELADELRRAS